jgi:hypothetical protein
MNQRVRASIRTSDVPVADSTTVDLSSSIKDEDLHGMAIVTGESLTSPHLAEYVKDLAFMNDVLTITVSESPDPNAENPVPAAVNGETRLFTRGQEYKVQRKFVDSLIKCEDRVKTINFKDADGVDQTKIERIPTLKYPLSIHHDPAGETGRRWFKHQCSNAW